MELKLLPPFNQRWNKGYKVFDGSTGRFRVVFYNTPEDISGMSFARYVVSVHLGYEVPDEYEVDHRNNDKTDDRLENLQLLTPEQNKLKQLWWYHAMVQKWTILPCTYCNELFYITERDLRFRDIETICCSRSCAASLQTRQSGPKILQEDIELIKQLRLQGLSSYKIADKTGFARNTVMKYWS